jgi:hypothetical protein
MPHTPNTYNRTHLPGPRPSAAQLKYLRALVAGTGTSFASPRTSEEASQEIARLKALQRRTDLSLERDWARRETRAIRETLTELPGQCAAPHDGEITGWGATARWA